MGGRPVRPRPSVGRTRQKVNELSFSAPRSRQGGVRGVASYLFEKFISPLETISFAPRNMIRETELHPRYRLYYICPSLGAMMQIKQKRVNH